MAIATLPAVPSSLKDDEPGLFQVDVLGEFRDSWRFLVEESPAYPVEQGSVQVLLQAPNGLGDGGLGHEQRLRGSMHPALVHHGQEVAQLPQIHLGVLLH